MMPKLKQDPIEDDPAIKPLLDAALAEAESIVERVWKEIGYPPNMMDKVPAIWKRAAKIMRERHGSNGKVLHK